MDALPPLAGALRYGNVRQTDAAAISEVVDGLVARISIGLPPACATLNDDAAAAMLARLLAVNGAVALLQNVEHRAVWQASLRRLADHTPAGSSVHGLLAGRACRILLDSGIFSAEEAARRVGLALSSAEAPTDAAAWIEGLLKDSGALLVHDDALWQIIDGWLGALKDEAFTQTLPLLRRTFATFAAPERRMLGERARAGDRQTTLDRRELDSADFDLIRGEAVLPLVARLLGLRSAETL